MAETKPWAIFVVVICTLFTSTGSILMKKGVDRFTPSLQGVLDAYFVVLGLFFYFLGFILLTVAFRHGELSVLFPVISLSFIWVAVFSYYFLGEVVTVLEMAGFAAIVLGVVMIGLSSRQANKLKLKG